MLKKPTRLVSAALLLIAIGMLFFPSLAGASEVVPNVTAEMLSPDFWIGKLPDPDRLIMNAAEIEAFNQDIIRTQPDVVYDLANYPASLDHDQLTKLVTKRPFPDEERYSGGIKVTSSYYANLQSQMNLPGILNKSKKATDEPVINYNVSVYVNGNPVTFPDQKPYLDESVRRVFVPIRFISEALGAKVEWLAEKQKVIIQKGDKQVILTIGSKTYSVGGQIYPIDAPAIIVNSRTMVPLRFVGEALGGGVTWTQGDDDCRVDISLVN